MLGRALQKRTRKWGDAYGGKYSAPDYERISASGCTLAIENTMINHTPDVKEKLQKLGLVVLTEQSSSEPEALGRVEWIKLFGVLFDKEDEAAHLFNEQKARVEQTSGLASSGKTVAYFYINSNGAAVTRRAGDYVAQMIELAGGSYALDDAQTASTSGSSVTLEMESFYATAKDADIIVYNGTIDESVATLNDFVGKKRAIVAVQSREERQRLGHKRRHVPADDFYRRHYRRAARGVHRR